MTDTTIPSYTIIPAPGSGGRILRLGDLDLSDCDTLDHGPGLNLGIDEVELVKLQAGSVDGEEIASSRYKNTEIFIPVLIGIQDTFVAVYELWLALRAELIQPTNELRFGYVGATDLWVFEIVAPASVPPLIGARYQTPPDVRKFEGYLPVILERRPGLPTLESI